MEVFIIQCGSPEFEIYNEVLDIFDNLTSAFHYIAEYESQLDEGIKNRSYEFFYKAAMEYYKGVDVRKEYDYYPSCFIREMIVHG